MTSPREVIRPVIASPPLQGQQVVNPTTGNLTPYGHRLMLDIWKRTGGFTDDLSALIGLVGLSQVSSLTASANQETVARELGDALAQVQAQNSERLRGEFNAFRRQANVQFAQLAGALGRPPQTRVIIFDADDTWRLNPDVRAIQVIAVGGGGGGGQGSVLTNGAGGGGGGGGGYSHAFMDARTLPESVAVTVGAGGDGGNSSFPAGGDGGATSFGSFLYANGGGGGTAGSGSPGTAGAETAVYGNMFQGGPGGEGQLADGDDAINDYQGAPGGGGGGGYNNGNGGDGAAGSWRAVGASGGGGVGGASGSAGAPGASAGDSDVYLGPGYGGGGGGGAVDTVGGAGGDGIVGAGGGGGGASGSSGGADGGDGGNGGDGRLWIVEFY